jgi:hypothetical protein
MSEFDPHSPALVHDWVNDRLINWTGELADVYMREAGIRENGMVEWNGRVYDGWDEKPRP